MRWRQWQFEAAVEHLPEPWKSVAAKQRTYDIQLSKDYGDWSYDISSIQLNETLDELMRMDRRAVKCNQIRVGVDLTGYFFKRIRSSKEEIERRLIPFVTSRASRFFRLDFHPRCPPETALVYLKMFKNVYTFKELDISYLGPISEQFLADQLEKNFILSALKLTPPWPPSEAIEQLLLKFLDSADDRLLDTFGGTDISQKLNLRLLKAAFDSWARANTQKSIKIRATNGVTEEEILSIPLPPNVT